MTLPDGISRKQASDAPPAPGLSLKPEAELGSARSVASEGAETSAQPSTRKSDSAERRGWLSIALRDAMSGAGLLPVDYKAKAWPLDRSGSQFLVLMNVAGHFGGDTHRLSSLEALITEAAKTRFDIAVTGVYWRMDPQKALLPAPAHRVTVPVATAAPASPSSVKRSASGAVSPTPAPVVSKQPLAARMREIFAPIEADDVAAFRRAKARASGDRDAGAEDETGTH